MKKLFSYFIPVAAGFLILFLVLPNYGGNLEIFVQKMAMDWEIPVIAMRIILSVATAIILSFLFDILSKVAVWLAVVVVLAAIFAPALLSDLPIVSEEVKTTIEQKLNL